MGTKCLCFKGHYQESEKTACSWNERKEIYANNVLVPRIHQEFLQFNNKKTNVKYGQNMYLN